MELIVLKAKRVKEKDGVYKGYNRTEMYKDGILKAIIPASSIQPRKGKKTIMLNCCKWKLEWEK